MESSHDGALAEFTALRQEILNRSTAQQNVLALQLSTSGALFGFALAKGSRATLLLIVPVLSYLLLTRYLMHTATISDISRYIRDELDGRVPGGLGWESYWRRQPSRLPLSWWRHPNTMLFPGSAGLALAWTAHTVFKFDGLDQLGLTAVWLLEFAVTTYSIYLMWFSSNRILGAGFGRSPGSAL
jgi:hypothetical protein